MTVKLTREITGNYATGTGRRAATTREIMMQESFSSQGEAIEFRKFKESTRPSIGLELHRGGVRILRFAVIRFNLDFFDLKIEDHDSQKEGDENCNEAFPPILLSAPVSLYEISIGCWGLVFKHHNLVPVSRMTSGRNSCSYLRVFYKSLCKKPPIFWFSKIFKFRFNKVSR